MRSDYPVKATGLKGTCFSPYVNPPKSTRVLQSAEELDFHSRSCQGTTSVLPQMQQNERGALAPEGMRLSAKLFPSELNQRLPAIEERSACR
jgi:hypothetical protein